MLTNQFFKKLVRRVLVVKDRNSSGLSKTVQTRKDQAVRNGNPLTIISFDPDELSNGNHFLANYFLRRVIIIFSKICIKHGIVFYFIEKELSLLLEATIEDSERIFAQVVDELRQEDVRLKYKIFPCFKGMQI